MIERNHSEDSDVDYEKEVLQLGRIWNEIKKSSPEAAVNESSKLKGSQNEASTTNAPTNKRQEDAKPNRSTNKSQSKKPKPQKPAVPPKSIPAAVLQPSSSSIPTRIQRNPKTTDPAIITITTNTHARPQSAHKFLNQRHQIQEQRILLQPLKRAEEKELYDMKCSVEEKNQEIALLTIANNRYHDKIAHLEREIEKRDEIIAGLRANERTLEKDKMRLYDQEKVWGHGAVEYENFKRDLKRLMQMLKTTAEYREFANLAIADGGVRFLHQANKKAKTQLDTGKSQTLHFCTCNKAFIPEPALWVPDNVYKHAKQFVSSRKGQLSPPELQLLLYDLNKMWRERQRTIINSLNAIKAQQLGVYRRKLQNQSSQKSDS